MTTSMFETNRNLMIDYMRRGEVTPGSERMGVELEAFVITEHCDETGETRKDIITYETGVKNLLEGLVAKPLTKTTKSEPVYIDSSLMGYKTKVYIEPKDRPAQEIGVEFSLEPASQFEMSVGPFEKLDDLKDTYSIVFNDLIERVEELDPEGGAYLIHCGYNPVYDSREMPLIDKERYHLMDAHFRDTGGKGIDMMRGTASTQVSIDYTSEQDFIEKYQVSQALAPVFSLITDNTPIYRKKFLTNNQRMMHARIWQDVDPVRCGLVPGTFDTGMSYAHYVDWVLSVPAILFKDAAGNTISTKSTPIKDLISNTDEPLTEDQIAHLFSMVFPDVRAKNFVEIRDADSMPLMYVCSLTALVKGIFYNQASFEQVKKLIGLNRLTDEAVLAARRALMNDGYEALVYGKAAHELILQLFEIAASGLSDEDAGFYLAPLLEHVQHQETIREFLWGYEATQYVTNEFHQIACELDGDKTSRQAMQEYLDQSYAIRKGKTINWAFTPKIYSAQTMKRFEEITSMTYEIMKKGTEAYLTQPAFRALFGQSDELNELIAVDPGYGSDFPICRVDIFYDENTGGFYFCELNTDGSSGMIFMHELSHAVQETQTFKTLAQEYTLEPFELFDTWVDEFIATYARYEGAIANPRIAIVDYADSVVQGDVKRFVEVFEEHEQTCSFVDINVLTYDPESRALRDGEGNKIDVIWRRAVASEILERKGEGAEALLAAFKDGAVCLIGSFRTQPAGAKDFLRILAGPEGAQILTPEEHAFLQAHVPATEILSPDSVNPELLSNPSHWIIKARDGYGGSGVYAGKDYSENPGEWRNLVDKLSQTHGYIAQEYIPSFKTNALVGAVCKGEDPRAMTALNNLTGLYLYGGKLVGVYTRYGAQSTITSFTGQINGSAFRLV